MKRNTITLLVVLLISSLTIAQKSELKSADKALKKGDIPGTKAALKSAEPLIANADNKYKAQYHYLRGKMYFDMVKKGMNTFESVDNASEAFNSLLEVEEASGKKKYTEEVRKMQMQAAETISNAAKSSYENKDYKSAAQGYAKVYRLSVTDTVFLYNAALLATLGKEYDTALEYYKELRDKKYTGITTEYYATNKETGQEQAMGSAQERDLLVKSGEYTNPGERKLPSKRADIVKNIALIYVEQGKDEEALKAIADARAEYPEDVNLILNEADIYLKTDNKEKYKATMAEAAAKAPDNAIIQYNIGVTYAKEKAYKEAREAYEKAIKLDPKFINAILNLSVSYTDEGNSLIEEMNELGNSRADIKKYDELKDKKDDLFKQGAKILENGLATNQGNRDMLEQLKNIYGALGDNDNFMRIKKMLE